MGMILAQSVFKNREGLLVIGSCRFQLAHRLEQFAQVVEAGGGVGVLVAEHLFSNGEGLLVIGPCRFQLAHGMEQ